MKYSFLFVKILLLAVAMSSISSITHFSCSAMAADKAAFSAHNLTEEIAKRRAKVREFEFIKTEAKKLGISVWLFGGTASGYAHYVNWDLMREHGDPRFQADRFDYDYSNIYRSTQDLDIVIDGDSAQAAKLQSALAETFPHFQGSKSAWEVRLLKSQMGDKEALLNNPNYLNQHTDSNSTGLIELTDPPKGESVVKDLRDWSAKEPYFLRDVHDRKLHYYFSPLHGTTTRAAEGKNPPIFSVVRYLTKAFQYDLEIRPEDEAQIKKIIAEFDPHGIKDSYAAGWIEKNGKKLMQNAVNLEYAWRKLKELGLSDKLASIRNDASTPESLAWWMRKQPILTEPVGQGNGETAAQIFAARKFLRDEKGRIVVAHETNSYLAYESITRAHTGEPNVLISRQTADGETAAHGDGFYTKAGREGARGTGLHIRFALDPKAREGTDFLFVPGEDYFVMKNKAAFRVIPESLNLSPKAYFEILANDTALADEDKGIFEKLRRQMASKSALMTKEELGEVADVVKANLGDRGKALVMLSEWVRLPEKVRKDLDASVVQAALATGTLDFDVTRLALTDKNWGALPELKELQSKYTEWDGVVKGFLKQASDWFNWNGSSKFAMVKRVKGAYDEFLVNLVKDNLEDPRDLRLALGFVADKVQHTTGAPIYPVGEDMVNSLLDKLGEGARDPSLLDFYLRESISYRGGSEALDEKMEEKILKQFFRPGDTVPKPTLDKIYALLSNDGMNVLVGDWERYKEFFPQTANETMRATAFLSGAVEKIVGESRLGEEIDWQAFQAFTRGFQKNFTGKSFDWARADTELNIALIRATPPGSVYSSDILAMGKILQEEIVEKNPGKFPRAAEFFEFEGDKFSNFKLPQSCGKNFSHVGK